MLKIVQEPVDGVLVVRLIGTIDEHSLLGKKISGGSKGVDVHCGEIERINSHGVIGWIDCFRNFRVKGVALRFFECSPALVQQLINIKNMIPKKEIESVCAPYICTACSHRFTQIFKTEKLVAAGLKSPKLPCPVCKETAELDDIDEEYFAFLA